MHTHQLLALVGLAAFANAAPAPGPGPMVTPIPPPAALPGLAARVADPKPRVTPIPPPAPVLVARQTSSEYSVQPLMSAPAAVSFGNFDPASMISSISASCAEGCAGTTTTITATSVPSVTSASAVADPTAIAIEYVVTSDIFPSGDYSIFIDGLAAMLTGSAISSETFVYNDLQPSIYGPPVNQYETQTNYFAPQQLQFTRWTADDDGSYSDNAGSFSMAITSQVITDDNSALCSEIAGPVSAALGAIPDVGPVFGVIGALVCDGA